MIKFGFDLVRMGITKHFKITVVVKSTIKDFR